MDELKWNNRVGPIKRERLQAENYSHIKLHSTVSNLSLEHFLPKCACSSPVYLSGWLAISVHSPHIPLTMCPFLTEWMNPLNQRIKFLQLDPFSHPIPVPFPVAVNSVTGWKKAPFIGINQSLSLWTAAGASPDRVILDEYRPVKLKSWPSHYHHPNLHLLLNPSSTFQFHFSSGN